MLEWKKSQYGISETLDFGYGFNVTACEDLSKRDSYHCYVNNLKLKREFSSLIEAKNHGLKFAIKIIDKWSKKIEEAPFIGT